MNASASLFSMLAVLDNSPWTATQKRGKTELDTTGGCISDEQAVTSPAALSDSLWVECQIEKANDETAIARLTMNPLLIGGIAEE